VLKNIISFACTLILISSPILGYSQNFSGIEYPTYGGGFSFGYSYYFPNDLNDYIDLAGYSSGDKEHVNGGLNVGLFVTYAPNKSFEFVPEFEYLYSKRSFQNYDLSMNISYVKFGGAFYYKREMYPGFNLRFGAGISKYFGTINREFQFDAAQTWKGSAFGFHGAGGGELILNSNTSVSLLCVLRMAKIKELKDENLNYVIPKNDGSNENLHLNFSGIELRAVVSYYF